MARSLDDLLSGLSKRKQQGYLRLPKEMQSDLIQYYEEMGHLPPLRRLPVLFGPECFAYMEPDRHGWMLM